VFSEAKDDGSGGDNWSYTIGHAKLQSNHHHQRTNIQFFTGRMPFLSPNQQSQSTEGKNITFHGLAYPKLGVFQILSLTTNSSWLPWRRVAMPLISPLMPVPQRKVRVSVLHNLYLLLPSMKIGSNVFIAESHQPHTQFAWICKRPCNAATKKIR